MKLNEEVRIRLTIFSCAVFVLVGILTIIAAVFSRDLGYAICGLFLALIGLDGLAHWIVKHWR